MQRHILWSPWTGPGLEHLSVQQQNESIIADGMLLGVQEHEPFRVQYELQCTVQWQLRAVRVSVLREVASSLHLLTDGVGNWTTGAEEPVPLLEGCLDVDLSCTPFTNTLPIRRLALQPGDQAIVLMAYIAMPQMQLQVAHQRYTCLDLTPAGGRYRFESLEHGSSTFTAELSMDQDGLVLDYPGLFRRVAMTRWSSVWDTHIVTRSWPGHRSPEKTLWPR